MRLTWFFLLTFCVVSSSAQAGEEDLYDFLWLDPDKTVYVLQNKVHPKDGSFYVDLNYVINTTSTFQDTIGTQLNTGYFFTEQWGLEFSYMSYSNTDNSTLKSVESVAGLAPFVRRPVESISVFAIYSPFYGKINTFNKIFYFDWSFGAALGTYKMESNLETSELTDQNRYDEENYNTLQLKTTFKVHMNRNIHLGIQFLNTNFMSNSPSTPNSTSWDYNNDLVIGLGVSF